MEKVTWYGSGEKPKMAEGQSSANGQVLSFQVGSVRSGEVAQVSNSGTGNEVVLDFVLPRGEKGEDSDSGIIGLGTILDGLFFDIETLKELLPFRSVQLGRADNSNMQLVENGQAACYKITFPVAFSKVPVLLVTVSCAAQQVPMLQVIEQTATYFLVAAENGGSGCLINWVAFETY